MVSAVLLVETVLEMLALAPLPNCNVGVVIVRPFAPIVGVPVTNIDPVLAVH